MEKRGKKKLGRNDPCPCGSGKKYKKCCLMKDQDRAQYPVLRKAPRGGKFIGVLAIALLVEDAIHDPRLVKMTVERIRASDGSRPGPRCRPKV